MSVGNPRGASELDSTEPAERTLVVGTVVGEGVVLHDATLVIGERKSRLNTIPCSFVMRLESGATVRVHVSRQTAIGPRAARDDRWEDIASEPLAKPFAKSAPGGHVRVQLRGVVISAGDRVAVEGEVEDHHREGGGYREGTEEVPSELSADLIGLGASATVWIEQQTATEERRQREAEEGAARKEAKLEERSVARAEGRELSAAWAMAVSMLGLAGVACGELLQRSDGAPLAYRSCLALGLLFLGLGLFSWRRRRFTPLVLQANDTSTAGDILWSIRPWASYLMGYGVPAALVIIAVGTVDFDEWKVVAFVVPLFVVVTFWGVVIVETRASARGLRLVASTRRASGDDWGRHEGTVVEGELLRRRTHRKTSSTHTETVHVQTTTGGTVGVESSTTTEWYEASQSGSGGTLKVDLGDRVIEVVVRGEARWGTTRRFIEGLRLTERLAAGDSVVMLGRIADGRMQSTGPESLVVFGSHRGPAHPAAVRALWAHRMGMLGFALVVLTALAFTAREIGSL